MVPKEETRIIDVVGCARCGRNHETVTFTSLDQPSVAYVKRKGELVEVLDAYWALCPTNHQPIMLGIVTEV